MSGDLFLDILFVVGAIVFVCIGVHLAMKRTRALAAVARKLGLTFSEDDPFEIDETFRRFRALSRGHDQYAENVLHGEVRNRKAIAFDYNYWVGRVNHGKHHHVSAAIIACEAPFPEIVIRPEKALDKLVGAVGFEDIDFESHEFSKKFFVKSRDRKLAYDVIHPRAMEYLLAHPRWSIELDGADALVSTGRTWKPHEFREALDALAGFLDLIPDYVWKDLASRKETS